MPRLLPRLPSASRPLVLAALAATSLLAACGRGGGATPSPRGETARATFTTAQGQPAGTATLTSLGERGVLVSAQLQNLPEGTHAFHINAVGRCEPPFESAGGHYNPAQRQHGFLAPNGQHNGDLPNITVRSDGTASAEAVAWTVTLRGGDAPLLDGDGSALVVHAGVDDYRTDPSGNAGPRIACGVVQR
ncbi:MAG TPA: superoxide dismutase family protein [Gemmatimonadaceae bacterium]|nr:superoxide dismutase family protein [Gemmatimonadaceae bacterium]